MSIIRYTQKNLSTTYDYNPTKYENAYNPHLDLLLLF